MSAQAEKIKEYIQSPDVCSYKYVYLLDNFFRQLIHNPRKLFSPYVEPGMNVLDIGCGRGFASLGLAKLVGDNGSVTSADLQPEMLKMVCGRAAKAGLADRIKLHRCKPDRVGVTGPFDFILAFWMAHETPDPSAFLEEVLSMMGDDGRFLLIEPGMHVSEKVFADFVAEAEEKGFILQEKPRIRLSRSAVFTGR